MSGVWHSLSVALGVKGELPTVDYYVKASLAGLISGPLRAGRITRHGPHTFAANGHLIVVRYATKSELTLLAGRKWQSVHYVIDDMLPVVSDCLELPAAYRQRLQRFASEVLPKILQCDPEIVAPRGEILDLFPQHRGALLDPAHLHLAQEHDHFAELHRAGHATEPTLRAAFLGTRSHGAGLDFLAEIAELARARSIPMALDVFLGDHIPAALARNPLVKNRKPLPWTAFRRMMEKQRYHALIAPLPDTLFNKGRSITKLMDAAAVGAAGLYSRRRPFSDRVTDDEDGILIDDRASDWADAIAALIGDPTRTQQIAAGGTALACRLGDHELQKAFWLQRLGLQEKRGTS